MKYRIHLLPVVIYLVSGMAMAPSAPAQQEERNTSRTVFDRLTDPFAQAQRVQASTTRRPKMTQQRRLIVNDDAHAQYARVNPRASEGVEAFLSTRLTSAASTEVDTYIWRVRQGPVPGWGRDGTATPEAIGDANQVMIDGARQAGMEIFGSLRMNDIHDALYGVVNPLKLSRPDLLIGEDYAFEEQYPHLLEGETHQVLGGYPESAVLRAFWSAFDYAEPEVRQYRLDFIEKICRQYDFDGYELDYFRHPLFFKLGEEEENVETMTEFVRQVRQLLNQIGRQRGRPYVLAIRVPDTPEMALRTGLDVEQWLKEGLLDMLVVGGGYMPYAGRHAGADDLAGGQLRAAGQAPGRKPRTADASSVPRGRVEEAMEAKDRKDYLVCGLHGAQVARIGGAHTGQ